MTYPAFAPEDPVRDERRKQLYEKALYWFRHWRRKASAALLNGDLRERELCRPKIYYWLQRLRQAKPIHPVFLELAKQGYYKRSQKRARGSKSPNAKLSEADVEEILVSQLTMPQLAEKYGVSIGTIEGILSRRTWRHVQIDPSRLVRRK